MAKYETTSKKVYLEVRVLRESLLQIPAEPAWVEDSEKHTDKEITPEYGHDSEEEVHDGQLDQLLPKHGLPAQFS